MTLNMAASLEQQENTQYGRFLTFNINEEVFGIGIEYVTEIIGMQLITKIPHTKDYIKGIINLRGRIIPVIDMRLKFGRQSVPYNDRTCIIVIDTEDMIVGLIVDQVREVMSIDNDSVAPPPNQKSDTRNQYIRGIGKVDGEVKLLLDCKKLFSEVETKEIGELE